MPGSSNTTSGDHIWAAGAAAKPRCRPYLDAIPLAKEEKVIAASSRHTTATSLKQPTPSVRPSETKSQLMQMRCILRCSLSVRYGGAVRGIAGHPRRRPYRTDHRFSLVISIFYDTLWGRYVLVRVKGLEPPRPYGQQILSLPRLPFRHTRADRSAPSLPLRLWAGACRHDPGRHHTPAGRINRTNAPRHNRRRGVLLLTVPGRWS